MTTTSIPVQDFGFFIGGQRVVSASQEIIRLPYDGSEVGRVGRGTREIAEQAIAVARRAAPKMASLTNHERAELLMRIRELVLRDAEALAALVMAETGKPRQEARVEVDRASQTLLAAAIAARELTGEMVPMDALPGGAGRLGFTLREPLGVIGIITPFNIPLNLALHKLAPALAAGNTVVHKPAEQTPLSALKLAELVAEAGAPEGAYNVVPGTGAEVGTALVESDDIAMITFTGSVATGKKIRAGAGLKRVTLELGGNGAVIIEPDVELDQIVPRLVQGAFSFSGQVCISVQRIYAHESIADQVTGKVAEAAAKLRIGHPAEEKVDLTSLISIAAAERVEQWLNEAVELGARRVTGGERRRATITPTVLADVPAQATLMRSELFGPGVAINRYSDLRQAIVEANSTSYGLQAGIYTNRLDVALRAARELQVGGVMINDVPTFRVDHMPYGGAKESGIGREGPKYAIQEMTESKLITLR